MTSRLGRESQRAKRASKETQNKFGDGGGEREKKKLCFLNASRSVPVVQLAAAQAKVVSHRVDRLQRSRKQEKSEREGEASFPRRPGDPTSFHRNRRGPFFPSKIV